METYPFFNFRYQNDESMNLSVYKTTQVGSVYE